MERGYGTGTGTQILILYVIYSTKNTVTQFIGYKYFINDKGEENYIFFLFSLVLAHQERF